MNRKCGVCAETIKRGEQRVGCSDCTLKAHPSCLEASELYNRLITLARKALSTEDQQSANIQIRCLNCVKKPPKGRLRCCVMPTLEQVFLLPAHIFEAPHADYPPKGVELVHESEEGDQPLSKRLAVQDSSGSEMDSAQIYAKLQTNGINDYISVYCLIELRRQRNIIEFSWDSLSYQVPRGLIKSYSSYKCRCGVDCDFSCVTCFRDDSSHLVCLDKFRDPSNKEFILQCVWCFEKRKRTLSSRKNVDLEPANEEDTPKEEVVKQKTLAMREGPGKCLDLFDNCLQTLTSKKIDYTVLELSQSKEKELPSTSYNEPRVAISALIEPEPTQTVQEWNKENKEHFEELNKRVSSEEPTLSLANGIDNFKEVTVSTMVGLSQTNGTTVTRANDAGVGIDDLLENSNANMVIRQLDENTKIECEIEQKASTGFKVELSNGTMNGKKENLRTSFQISFSEPPKKNLNNGTSSICRIDDELNEASGIKAMREAVSKYKDSSDFGHFKVTGGNICYPEVIDGCRLVVFESDCQLSSQVSEKIKLSELKAEPRCSRVEPGFDSHLFPKSLKDFRVSLDLGCFTRYCDVLFAFDNLIDHSINIQAQSPSEKVFYGHMYSICMGVLLHERNIPKYYTEQIRDLTIIVNDWKDFKIPCTYFPRVPRCGRQYIEIKDYEPAVMIA